MVVLVRWVIALGVVVALGALLEPAYAQSSGVAASNEANEPSTTEQQSGESAVAIAAPSDKERALALHDEAKTLYGQGKYREAMDRLREALLLDPNAKVLHYNLGLIEEKRGNFEAALTGYRRCLDLETDARERRALLRIIERLEGAQQYAPFGVAAAPPPPATSAPAAPKLSGDGDASTWVWVSGGVAVASFGLAAILAASAADAHPGADAETSGDVTVQQLRDDAATAHQLAIGADMMLLLGTGAAAATAVLAFTLHDGDGDTGAAVQLQPAGARMTWRY